MFRLLIGLIGVLLLTAAVGCESEPDPTARPAPTTPPVSTSTPRPCPDKHTGINNLDFRSNRDTCRHC